MPKFRLPQLYLGGGPRRRQSPGAGLRYAGSSMHAGQPSHNPLARVPWTLVALGLGAAAVVLVLAIGVLSLTRSSLFRVHSVQVGCSRLLRVGQPRQTSVAQALQHKACKHLR